LKDSLKGVDVVFEVRDSRIPLATGHPDIQNWIKTGSNKKRLLVLNRMDCVTAKDRSRWSAWLNHHADETVFFTDAKTGKGLNKLKKAALECGEEINDKRRARGLKPRAIRAVVVGFPNVGKSALVNRLIGKRACDSAPRPGVTRSLRWVRVGDDFEMLDSPGILPPRLEDQQAAARLAICNDIGEASYITSLVAAGFVDGLRNLPDGDERRAALLKMYKLEEVEVAHEEDGRMTGEDVVRMLADNLCAGDLERAATKILKDYQRGRLGHFCLEAPPF